MALFSGRRALVVEDEYFIAQDIAKALSAAGAEIIGPVGETNEALRSVAEEQIDFAVLDINLRGEMSFPVAAELDSRGVPFVFATGYESTIIPPTFAHIPTWRKPFDPAALVRALAALEGERR
jgi:DNA-binding response OmpR family regulator